MFFQRMNRSKANGKGFTLIELIMVIVILGILAATALPKFFALTDDASKATANGIGASLRASLSGLYAQYIIGNTVNPAYNLTTIVLNAQISGIKTTNFSNNANAVMATIGGRLYTWAFVSPSLPTDPGNLTDGYSW